MVKFLDTKPKIAETSFIALGSQLIGALDVGEYSSIWFGVDENKDNTY